jgi:hypothetical protein
MEEAVKNKIRSWFRSGHLEGTARKLKGRIVYGYGARRGFVNIEIRPPGSSPFSPVCVEVPAKLEKEILLGWTPFMEPNK